MAEGLVTVVTLAEEDGGRLAGDVEVWSGGAAAGRGRREGGGGGGGGTTSGG